MTYTVQVENGVRVLRYPFGSKGVKWRADCDACLRMASAPNPDGMLFFPAHDAMPSCRSGGRDHCTCDGCF